MISHTIERRKDKLHISVELDLNEAVAGAAPDSPYFLELARYLERRVVPDILDVVGILVSEDEELGTVKWFDDSKGFGFIRTYDNRDVFVHHTGIGGTGYRTLQQGQRVRFKCREGRETISAVEVFPVEPTPQKA
jgi:CspA family cold shock protein